MLKFLQTLAKIKKPSTNLTEELLKCIKNAAEKAQFKNTKYPNGLKIENGENGIVVVQFGGRRNFYEAMEMLENEDIDYRVIITSSNVKSMRISEIKWILNNKYQTKKKWIILDIEHKESPKTVNFMLYEEPEIKSIREEPQRRKKIYGKRGEHKEQD